jgi:hypothetical protein
VSISERKGGSDDDYYEHREYETAS